MSSFRWTPPPNWPNPPEGWSPPPGWSPDPSWGPPPDGWQFWQAAGGKPWDKMSAGEKQMADPARFKKERKQGNVAVGVIALLIVGGCTALTSGGSDDPGTAPRAATTAPSSSPAESTAVESEPTAVESEPAAADPGAPSQRPSPTPQTAEALIEQAEEDEEGSALALLGALAVKGRAGKDGYDRDLFGQSWADTDRNGCDTRNDILRRDLKRITFREGTRDCVVMSGVLADPLTGRTITFAKADADAVQIDHVVSLSDAWQKGARQWDPGKRLAFANDPLNLMAVDGPTNGSKSDSDAATWLPPNRAFRCAMVARQTAVKAKYELWVTAAERDAIARVLAACPKQRAPESNLPTVAAVAPQKPSSGGGTYASCAAVRAAGKAPLRRGQPGYSLRLDRDRDGVACDTTAAEDTATTTQPTSRPPRSSSPAAEAATSYANCAEVRAAGKAPLRRGQPGYSTRLDRDRDDVACDT